MKVAILGSGIVGQTLGGGFLKHGHQVMMGTRDPKKEEVANWVAETPGATAGTFSGAGCVGGLIGVGAFRGVADTRAYHAGWFPFVSMNLHFFHTQLTASS